MTRMGRSFGVAALTAGALMAASVLTAQSTEAVPVKANGTTVLSRKIGKILVRVSLRTEEIPSLPPKSASARDLAAHWSCTSVSSCLLTIELKMNINGTAVDVPPQMLYGMGDPNRVQISWDHGKTLLTVTGGDASGGYRMVAMVQGHRITGYDYFSLLDDSVPLFTVRFPPQPSMDF